MNNYVSIPQNVKAVGHPEEDKKIKIYISRKVHRKVYAFAKIEKELQTGGIMMGNVISNNGEVIVILGDFIIAEHTRATKESLTFTVNTWKYLEEEMKKYPDMRMVGWVHTNPDRGIEISEYDAFLQSHIFKDTNAVLHIIDPVQVVETYYYLDGKEMRKAKGFYVFTDDSIVSEDAKDDAAVEKQEADTQNEDTESGFAEDEFHKLQVDEDEIDRELEEVFGKAVNEDMDAIEESEELKLEELKLEEPKVEELQLKELKSDDLNVFDIRKRINSNFGKNDGSHDKKTVQDQSGQPREPKQENVEEPEETEKTEVMEDMVDTGKADEAEEAGGSGEKTGTSPAVKIVIAILLVVVIALSATVGMLTFRLDKMKNDISTLYKNDEALANYINTEK